MDPFSALAITTALLQFIDFGVEVLKEADSLRSTGSTISRADFANAAKECKDLTETLKKRTPPPTGPGSEPLHQHEQALAALLGQCSRIGNELTDVLQSLQVEPGQNKWKSFGTAIKAVWNADKVRGKMEELHKCQNQVAFRLLACIGERLDLSNGRLDTYHGEQIEAAEHNKAEIKEILAIGDQKIQRVVQGQTALLQHQLTQDRKDILAAILTLSNGETRVLHGPAGPDWELDGRAKNVMRLTFDRADAQSSEAGDEYRWLGDMSLADYQDYKSRILDCLHFRFMIDRYDIIESAHRRTFEWVFEDSQQGASWSDLSEWLASDQPCYWINGKAASGKSTLMKFIYNHPRTKDHLRKWSGSGDLVVPAFFFYYLGTQIQKSQAGLLRSLLYSVLEKKSPDFMLRIMPDLCREVLKLPSETPQEPGVPELRRWFRNMVAQANDDLRFFFVIDGLDEYDGDLSGLIDLINDTSTPHVKYLVSSRPVTACSEAFANLPGLRLQDLTVGDIRQYVQDRLGPKLERKGERYNGLVEMLVEKASGVFLWVTLVVNSLLEGIRDGDTFDELLDRTEQLPPDLKQLFSVMLQRVPPHYRVSSSKLLQLVLTYLDMHDLPILALQLSYTQDSWEDVLSMKSTEISRSQQRNRCDDLESRIRSRCCGLLEYDQMDFRDRTRFTSERSKPIVRFVHKTAVEYLRQNEVPGLSGQDSPWTCHADLFKSCIALLKSFCAPMTLNLEQIPYSQVRSDSWTIAWYALEAALSFASKAEEVGSPISMTHWDEFHSAASSWWKGVDDVILRIMEGAMSQRQVEREITLRLRFARPWCWGVVFAAGSAVDPARFLEQCPHEIRSLPSGPEMLNAILCAFRWNVSTHLQSELERRPEAVRKQLATWLLQMSASVETLRVHHSSEPGHRRNFRVSQCYKILLQNGADPMASATGRVSRNGSNISVHALFLQELFRFLGMSRLESSGEVRNLEAVVLQFIQHGAPVNVAWDGRTLRQRLDEAPEGRVVGLRTVVSSHNDDIGPAVDGNAPEEVYGMDSISSVFSSTGSHGIKRRWLKKSLDSMLRRY